MKNFRLIISVIIICSICRMDYLMAQNSIRPEAIDELFQQWNNNQSPGIALGIVSDGQLIYTGYYGMADLEHEIPLSSSSVFDIASLSKQFTGMAIAMLIHDGKISVEDPVQKYLPDFPEYDEPITIGHLLHHTSGIRDWPTLFFAAGIQFDDVISFDQILKMVYNQKELNFTPGDEYIYSNSGYNLLAKIVEVVSETSFYNFSKEHILTPLEMKSSHFQMDHRRIIPGRTNSYAPGISNSFLNIPDNLTAVGSSSLFSTVEDLSRWVINFGSKKIGGKEVIEMMTKKTVLNNGTTVGYGFGIGVGEYHTLPMWSHTGGWAGYRTVINYFPDQDFGVILLSNLATVNATAKAFEVIDLYLSGLFPKLEEAEKGEYLAHRLDSTPQVFNPSTNDLEEFTGIFTSNELNNSFKAVVKGGKLTLTQFRMSEIPLNPDRQDLFIPAGIGGELRFERSVNGEITGFRWTMPRTRNLLFKKE